MVSVDVSNDCIFVVTLQKQKQGLRIGGGSMYPLEIPIFDKDGQVDPTVLKEQLREALNGVREQDVAITFSTLPTVTNTFQVPFTKKKDELVGMIRQKVFTNMSPEEYMMDYMITGESMSEEIPATEEAPAQPPRRQYEVLTYAVPRSIVTASQQAVTALKKRPRQFCVAHNNIFAFALQFLRENSLIIANITSEHMNLHLLNRPDSLITRSFPFVQSDSLDILGSMSGASVSPANQVYDQLSRLLQYQAIKFAGREVEQIYLMGSMADEGLRGFLGENLTPPVELLTHAELPIRHRLENVGNYAYALGAALT